MADAGELRGLIVPPLHPKDVDPLPWKMELSRLKARSPHLPQ